MAETEGSDDTSENELLNRSLSVWKGNKGSKEEFEPIPLDLHTGSSLGLYDCVETHIIRGKIDIDKKNKGGWTALMYACYIGHESIVSLLLENGCNVNLRNQKKETSLMLASSCGNDRVGRLLCGQGSELEFRDARGWTALFHATYSGHQNMVSFLLQQGANMNAVEPSMGMTPFMEAAAEGHEIILQLFLQHGVNVNAKAYNGDTARSLALINGNMKIVSLIDNHVMPITSLRAEAGLDTDLSTSDDVYGRRNKQFDNMRVKTVRGGPSITDGPKAIDRLIKRTGDTTVQKSNEVVVPKGYVSFSGEDNEQTQKLSYRDVTSPINPEDYKLDSSSSREYNEVEDDTNAFSKTGALTIKSSSGSSGGLAAAFGIRREDSLDSDEFPQESSCGDSHHHGNSGESSSEEGIDEQPAKQVQKTENTTLDRKHSHPNEKSVENLDKKGDLEKKKSTSMKSKELRLTTEKVSEIEVMKNSVSEWIDSVQDPHPIPEHDFESQDNRFDSYPTDNVNQTDKCVINDNSKTVGEDNGDHDKDAAIKPEYLPKLKQSESPKSEHTSLTSTENQIRSLNVQDDRSQNHNNTPDSLFQKPSNPSTTVVTSAQGPNLANPGLPHTMNYQGPEVPAQGKNIGHVLNVSSSSSSTQLQQQQPPQQQHHHHHHHDHPELKHFTGAELIEQVANNVNKYDSRPSKEFLQTNPVVADSAIISVGDHSITPVSALNLLNTADGYKNRMPHNPHANPPSSVVPASSNHGNQGQRVQAPPPGFNATTPPSYHMYPHQNPSLTTLYPPPSSHTTSEDHSSSNIVFLDKMKDCMPLDLSSLLEQLGLSKYMTTFEEQDVDLQVFLSLTDNDLKEIGIKLFGPRKKMMNGIARWHSKARIAIGELEQAYADRLEGEMQEMGVQLQLALEQLEKLKAQVKQEQQLRNVTESCLMEERGAWQHVQRIIMETRQHCEDLKDAFGKTMQCVDELKSRVLQDSMPGQGQGQQKRPIRGSSAIKEDKNVIRFEQMPTDSVIRKVDYNMREIQHLLGCVTQNTDHLLGRSRTESPDRLYPS
ncbi:Ankyrin repeat and SAM domain-containing protein 3 [Mactra antiquata]